MSVRIAIFNNDDRDILAHVAAGVFDRKINISLCDEFLRDPRHHFAVAIDSDTVVGWP